MPEHKKYNNAYRRAYTRQCYRSAADFIEGRSMGLVSLTISLPKLDCSGFPLKYIAHASTLGLNAFAAVRQLYSFCLLS